MFNVNLILWIIGSVVAISILMKMMRSRRDQLVEQLKQYVDREKASETSEPVDSENE